MAWIKRLLSVSMQSALTIASGHSDSIEITGILPGRNLNLLSVSLSIPLMGHSVPTHFEFPVPRIHPQFDELESLGIEWSQTSGYFSDKAVAGLRKAYVGALVGIGYPQELGLKKLTTIDQWLRLAFYADKVFDELSAHDPGKIYQLRKRIETVLTGADRIRDKDPDIVKGFYNTYFDNDFLKNSPSVLASFLECLEKNEQEAQTRLGPDNPNAASIEKIRIKSCGGYHCIVVGAAAFGINAEEFFEKFTYLRTMSEQVSLCTGWSNDVVSAEDEHREVLLVRSHFKASDDESRTYHSLNLVHNFIAEHTDDAGPAKEKIQAAVEFVALKFNQEVFEFYKFKNLLQKELSNKHATVEERDKVGKLVDVMERWIETTAWQILAEKHSHLPCTAQTFALFIARMGEARDHSTN
jgi:hypothetical protein